MGLDLVGGVGDAPAIGVPPAPGLGKLPLDLPVLARLILADCRFSVAVIATRPRGGALHLLLVYPLPGPPGHPALREARLPSSSWLCLQFPDPSACGSELQLSNNWALLGSNYDLILEFDFCTFAVQSTVNSS